MRKISLAGFIAVTFSVVCLIATTYAFAGERADIRGTITHLSRIEGQKDVLGRVLIEGVKEADTRVDRASVTVTAQTRLFIIQDGERVPAAFTDLEKGQQVAARLTGPVLESYPVQATAAEVSILRR